MSKFDIDDVYVELASERVAIRTGFYAGGNIAIRIFDSIGFEPITTLSVNIVGTPLEEGEFCCKNFDENASLAKELLEGTNLFEDTGRRVESGFCAYPIWKFRIDNL